MRDDLFTDIPKYSRDTPVEEHIDFWDKMVEKLPVGEYPAEKDKENDSH